MKKLFCKILFSTSLLIFLQNHALAQNIFDELKKAGEQLQKEIDKPDTKQKPPASGAQQPASPKPAQTGSSSSPIKQDETKAKTNASNNFSLFGLKLGDPISSAKITNKQLEKDKLIGFLTALRVGAHVTFEPKTKNEYFDSFFITYGPISKKIEGIYGRSKKTFKNESECLKASEDNFLFVIEKNASDNPNAPGRQDTSGAGKLSVDIVSFSPPSSERIIIYNFCNPALGAPPDYNWLAIFKDDRKTGLIYKELEQYNAEKSDKEYQKKKESGKLKGL